LAILESKVFCVGKTKEVDDCTGGNLDRPVIEGFGNFDLGGPHFCVGFDLGEGEIGRESGDRGGGEHAEGENKRRETRAKQIH